MIPAGGTICNPIDGAVLGETIAAFANEYDPAIGVPCVPCVAGGPKGAIPDITDIDGIIGEWNECNEGNECIEGNTIDFAWSNPGLCPPCPPCIACTPCLKTSGVETYSIGTCSFIADCDICDCDGWREWILDPTRDPTCDPGCVPGLEFPLEFGCDPSDCDVSSLITIFRSSNWQNFESVRENEYLAILDNPLAIRASRTSVGSLSSGSWCSINTPSYFLLTFFLISCLLCCFCFSDCWFSQGIDVTRADNSVFKIFACVRVRLDSSFDICRKFTCCVVVFKKFNLHWTLLSLWCSNIFFIPFFDKFKSNSFWSIKYKSLI